MACGCATRDSENYNISVIQGDYSSFLFILTDQKDDAIANVKSVIFTCAQLNLQQELTAVSDREFTLVFNGTLTQTLTVGSFSYDVTVQFKDEEYKTAIYNGVLTVLKKENGINENS